MTDAVGLVPVEGCAPYSGVVRVTHWVSVAAVAGLFVSGVAVLLAHPRLYWGETGTLGTPALLELPLPLVLTGQTGWGRSLHFLSAWILVGAGLVYVASGVRRGHFRSHLLPRHAALSRPGEVMVYGRLQRRTYVAVVFLLVPAAIWTGLAMSPAVTSVVHPIVELLGGHQSARTLHFVAACLVVLFTIAHLVMVCRAGFVGRMRKMVFGPHADGWAR